MEWNYCVLCGNLAEKHHIKTRKSGGTDDADNILFLCRKHHSQWHYEGPGKMLEKYPSLSKILRRKGHSRILDKIKLNYPNK